MDYSFGVPTLTKILKLDEMNQHLLKTIRNRKLLLIISKSMIERFDLIEFTVELKKNNSVVHITEVPNNPTEISIKNALDKIDIDIDIVIALGGGSTIDLAKALVAFSYLLGSEYTFVDIKNAILNREYLDYNKGIELIAIPTTAGTGSEVTSWATIWDSNKKDKMSIEAKRLAPNYAYIIPELTLKLPDRLTLSTGLDALSHATESYWAKKSNEISRELSKTAIRHIVEYLPKVLQEPDNIEYRTKMCIGSVFAGMAFANTKTTACHAISYPITMLHDVEHGFAVALTLIPLMKKNKKEIVEFDQLLQAFNASSIIDIQKWLNDTCKGIQQLRLRDFNISIANINELIDNSFTAGRMDNNPIELFEKDVLDILNEIY